MGRRVTMANQRALAERYRDKGRRALEALKAACDWADVYRSCRAAVLATPEFSKFERRLRDVEKARAALARAHRALARPGEEPPASLLASTYEQLHVTAAIARFESAVWARMQARLEATPAGAACLDFIWRMVDADGLVLEAVVNADARGLVAGLADSRPKLTRRQLELVRVDIAA
jgi:hypothetical protein